jgi:hypothetical protein
LKRRYLKISIDEFVQKLKEKETTVTPEQAAQTVGGTVEEDEDIPFN